MGKTEALVLFEPPHDFHRQPTLQIKDEAERLGLVRVDGALESTLIEPFSTDYDEIIGAVRADLLQLWGDRVSPQS